MAPEGLPRVDEIQLDSTVLVFTACISVLAGLLFGLVPVLRFANPHLASALKEGGRASSDGKSRHRVRNVLVVAEIALALGHAQVNIEDMALYPAADMRTGAISIWIAGSEEAERAAEDIIEDARAREREIRLGAEDYADEILNTLEVNLSKFIAAVQRGRERLQGKDEPAEVR